MVRQVRHGPLASLAILDISTLALYPGGILWVAGALDGIVRHNPRYLWVAHAC